MSIVNINSVQRQVLQLRVKKEPPGGIELSSFKRNRSIAIAVLSEGLYTVHEKGYVEQNLQVEDSELAKVIKTMIKREFPRSRKVRVHKFTHPDELDRPRKTL